MTTGEKKARRTPNVERINPLRLSDLPEEKLASLLTSDFPQVQAAIKESFPYSPMRNTKLGTKLAQLSHDGHKKAVYIQENGSGIIFIVNGIARKVAFEWMKGESCDLPIASTSDPNNRDQLVLKVEPSDNGLVVTAQPFGFHYINGDHQFLGEAQRVYRMEKPQALAHFLKQLKSPYSERETISNS